MKKRLLAAAVAATITLSMGVAMAAPVEFDGSAQVHYRWNDHDVDGTSESAKSTFLLNAKAALDDNLDVYARFATQRLHAGYSSSDFSTDHYGDTVSTIDRYGIVVKGKDSTFKIGRQGATIGATALLYSTEGYIGSYMGAIDGVSGSAKIGVTDLGFVAGKEDGNDNKVYALHASFQPAEAWTTGATVAKYDVDAADATNYWAVDAAYAQGKVGYFAEYAKSDADTKNKAYVIGASYTFDAKNSFSANYNKVEEYGAMGNRAGWTDFDGHGKGMYYSYNYKITSKGDN
ncbi:hypothetical protein HA075_15000 [bacterium BFN5]|nr:hypothetical protein HA075_15000 [bacterium BFN5]